MGIEFCNHFGKMLPESVQGFGNEGSEWIWTVLCLEKSRNGICLTWNYPGFKWRIWRVTLRRTEMRRASNLSPFLMRKVLARATLQSCCISLQQIVDLLSRVLLSPGEQQWHGGGVEGSGSQSDERNGITGQNFPIPKEKSPGSKDMLAAHTSHMSQATTSFWCGQYPRCWPHSDFPALPRSLYFPPLKTTSRQSEWV